MKFRCLLTFLCLIFASQAFAGQGGSVDQRTDATYTYRSRFREELQDLTVAREAPIVDISYREEEGQNA